VSESGEFGAAANTFFANLNAIRIVTMATSHGSIAPAPLIDLMETGE
jgi:hypothetical protein